jgi:hypothetical protein
MDYWFMLVILAVIRRILKAQEKSQLDIDPVFGVLATYGSRYIGLTF